MKINQQTGLYIATYLSKGAFEQNYRDLKIQIGADAEIGITKHGRFYNLYINYLGKTITQGKAKFEDNITTTAMSKHVMDIINTCSALNDVELNLKKIPIEFAETTEAKSTNTQAKGPMESDEEDITEHVINQNQQNKSVPAKSSAAITQEVVPEPVESSESKDNNDNDKINDSLYNDADNPTIIPDEEPPVKEEEPYNLLKKQDLIDYNDLRGEKNMIKENSYIYKAENDNELKEHMRLLFDAAVQVDREFAVELFIRGVNSMSTYYNGTNEMSDKTKIDERSISLAILEKNLITQ